MIKLQTPVEIGRSRFGISYEDKILMIGSCFADNVGEKMVNAGFDVRVNPFGTLYNPVSVCNSLNRLAGGPKFTQMDCVEMGAGVGLTCSFSHHTSFARRTAEEFLEEANSRLEADADFYSGCNRVVITLGTAWCYRHSGGQVVSNCLKRDAREFDRELLSVNEIVRIFSDVIESDDRRYIFTVSPIRHFRDGAHANQISKSILLLAIDEICSRYPDRAEYFPSYEIVLDELRDYRFYAEDMMHPSSQAVGYVWERFIDFALPESQRTMLAENERRHRQSLHRPILFR